MVIRDNQIRDNTQFGVKQAGFGALVDARGNWWGVSSGPFHATLNPAGGGNAVSDNVLFEPWLQAPPTDGGSIGDSVEVNVGAPDFVSPGQTVDYAVHYLNLRSTAVDNALLVLQLPQAAEYLASSDGGVYWPERHQVVWKRGQVAAGASAMLSTRVRFMWGLPRGYRDGALAQFSGDNYLVDSHAASDRSLYQSLDVATQTGNNPISSAAYQAERDAAPALAALHAEALGHGYQFHSAMHVSHSDGRSVTAAIYIHPNTLAARILSRAGSQAAATTLTRDAYTVHDADGGLRLMLDSGERSSWGSWATSEEPLLGPYNSKLFNCTFEICRAKCQAETIGWAYVGYKSARILGWTALGLVTGGVTTIGVAVEVGELAKVGLDIWRCSLDCHANPNTHCCDTGQVKWTKPFGLSLLTQCFKYNCSASGTWKAVGGITCTTGSRCVASIGGIGCVPCDERYKALAFLEQHAADPANPAAVGCDGKAASGKPRCRDLELFVAKDPNDITGVEGDLLPGQLVDYTIRYENEGQGRAYGVYIVNDLPAELDEGTLTINNGGWYVAHSRQLVWLIGELGPQGDNDAEGAVSYSVRVKAGLASGTPVANQAVVYFPSVPETTPTNTWVNLVAPLAAIPQSVQTTYMTALPLTLAGREISGLPLSFRIEQPPLRGSLSGTPPNLTYTPAVDTVGADGFTFSVGNGVSESRPAAVRISVAATGDSHAPHLLSMFPEPGASAVEVTSSGLYSDTQGPVYGPVVVVVVSEALDPDSVTTGRVTLNGPAGPVAGSVTFDGSGQRILLLPREPLAGLASHTLTLGAGITDLAGNQLPAASFSFTTAAAPPAPSPTIFHDGFEARPAR